MAVVSEKVGFDSLILLDTDPQSSQSAGEHLTRGASRPTLASGELARTLRQLAGSHRGTLH